MEQPFRRRLVAAAGMAVVFAVPGLDSAAQTARRTPDVPLPGPPDWNAALEASRTGRMPIVLMFSRAGCPYCIALRRDSLRHLAAEAPQRGVLFFELDVADGRPIGAGSAVTGMSLAREFEVTVTPTVVFVGPGGELAERLLGYGSRDFYNAYLDERIELARKRLAGS
jgi:thiol-disulfide isomerase/thioredoxin